MACYAFLLCLLRCDLPQMRLVAVLALQVHLKMYLMLAGVRDILVAFNRTVCPVRSRFNMRIMTCITVQFHGCISRYIDLLGLLYRFSRRSEMSDINCAVSCQPLSYSFISVAEETFISAGQKIFCPVSMAVEAG